MCPEPKWKLVVEVSGNAPDFSSSNVVAQAMSDHDPLEKRIATLLGDHMPLSDLTSGVPPTEAERKREALLPHFLSLRLLLLRQVKQDAMDCLVTMLGSVQQAIDYFNELCLMENDMVLHLFSKSFQVASKLHPKLETYVGNDLNLFKLNSKVFQTMR